MGSCTVTTGTIYVKDCKEIRGILEELELLAECMDERQVDCKKADKKKYGPGVLQVDIGIYGQGSASVSTLIDDTIQQLGPFAIAGARFDTEWEAEKGYFFVGTEEQVAKAGSAYAVERILELLPELQGDDIDKVLHSVISLEKKIPYPCPHCGREEDGRWYAPCPSDDCPSRTDGSVEPTIAGRVAKVEGVFRCHYEADVNNAPEANVSDILADLRHYCDQHGLDLGGLDSRAHRHYLAELDEEKQS